MNNNNKPHRRLLSQLKKSGLSQQSLPYDFKNWQEFLYRVNRTYQGSQEAQKLLERSISISSKEMHQLYDELKEETEQRIEALQRSEEKSRFMANMSHEIRTPVHGILGSLDILKGTDLDERQTLFIDTAYASCEAMLDVINNILDHSKIRANQLELEMVEFSPRELVEDVSNIMATTAQDKMLEVLCFIPDDVPARLRGDSSRLRQMLMNLMSNAIKFTEQGEVYTRIEVLSKEGKEARLHFEVRDTGIGIEKAMQKSVFDSFIQVDASITRRYGGTGLGLTIVKEFAEMMGGTVGVESVEGKGSRFWFDVSLEVVNADMDTLDNSLKNLNVLIVDDVATNRTIFESYLQSWEMNPFLASNAHEALDMLEKAYTKNQLYDLMLIDWYMPKMDGLSLAREISQDPRFNHIPMIMLSSYGISKEKQERAGIDASLTKPIRSSTLKGVLADSFRRNQKHEMHPENKTVSQASAKKKIPLRNGKILLAEDNDINALIAMTMLEDSGLTIEHVVDGKQAVEAVKKADYDLVLMDIHMPGMDGYTATQLIREIEAESMSNRHTPIIAMTANALKGDREKCLKAGMDDYISKPVNKEDLNNKVAQWQEKSATQPAYEECL
jgi:signal transduction histidine kinase/DNA-binding response OmpR family regulator